MALSPQWLDELRARITLSGVISRTTRLTKAGREFKACCPFHNEKSPSFTVNDDKGFYHCFGCGAHGDVIRWMTDQRGLAFMDAIKELAVEAGMEVPAPDPQAARQAEKRDTLVDVMQAAQDWFVASLRDSKGAGARDYLERRGFDAFTIERFGFGYAPDDRQALKAALSRFPEEMLIEAGLRIDVKGRDPYDRFRGRLMLPIQDARGRVIAFGGRILDGANKDAPKYLNSPDTPLFDKGRTLYNLHRAAPAARKSERIIVVEGYMDVIALAAAGIEECVAPMGTALTEQQIELLWRQADNPVLCFDGDAAGQRAAMRAVTRALPMLRPGHSLRMVGLPSGLDPDDLLKQQGTKTMEALLGNARSLVDVLWQSERDAQRLDTPEAKAGLKARLLAHVDTIGDSDIRSLYRRELLDAFSAFAYPAREPARPFERRSAQARQNRHVPSQQESLGRLRHNAQGGSRDALAAAVLAGLIRWPAQIARHAETLAGMSGIDPRFGILADYCDAGQPLESTEVFTILAKYGMTAPEAGHYSGMRFGFLDEAATAQDAAAELDQAIELLVERPALDRALASATARFEQELSDDAYAEQQRLLKRKLEFDRRLVQMASNRAAMPEVM